MHSDPEPTPGALAARPAGPLAEPGVPLTGGAGLFDHSARDAFSPSAVLMAGVAALVLTLAVGVWLVGANPAFESGKAGGTANQLGALAAAGAALEPGSPAAEGAQIIAHKNAARLLQVNGPKQWAEAANGRKDIKDNELKQPDISFDDKHVIDDGVQKTIAIYFVTSLGRRHLSIPNECTTRRESCNQGIKITQLLRGRCINLERVNLKL